MYGLIKKELLIIKQNLKTFILTIAMFIGLTIINESDMTFIMPFMAVMISISTFSYDNYNRFDAYVVTLPNGRKNVVRAKYISTLFFVLICFLIAIIALFIMYKSGINIDFETSVAGLIGCLVAVSLIISFMFPILYKFGVEKGRIALFIFSFGITGIAALISQNVHIKISTKIISIFKNYYMVLIPLVSCTLLILSYLLSNHFYKNKEF